MNHQQFSEVSPISYPFAGRESCESKENREKSNMVIDSVEWLCSKTVTLPLLGFFLYKLIYTSPVVKEASKSESSTTDNESSSTLKTTSNPNDYGALGVPIHPVDADFDWSTKEPHKYRPFKKGPYKLTMGIHNIIPDDWLLIENTYKQYTDLRERYVKDPKMNKHTIFLADDAIPHTVELYEMVVQFLLQRYPMYFQARGDKLYNKIRDEYIPLNPHDVEDKRSLNEYLAKTIEEDFIILYKDLNATDSDEYVFKSGAFVFPSGFDPLERAYKPLSAVHGPVPEYREKLRPQMNKFFEKFKPFNYVRRNNWSIQTHNKLNNIELLKGEEDEILRPFRPDELDFKREVYFRSERQILTRLPKTGAIVFSIRTYCVPMADIRNECVSGELIGGIEGMQDAIGQYKRRPEWGDAVIEFLKGETEGADKPWITGLE